MVAARGTSEVGESCLAPVVSGKPPTSAAGVLTEKRQGAGPGQYLSVDFYQDLQGLNS